MDGSIFKSRFGLANCYIDGGGVVSIEIEGG